MVDTQSAERAALHGDLAEAADPAAAQPLNAALWQIWTTAPDPDAQALLDAGLERLRLGDRATAVESFTALIAYCPDYAEGYNQRAFARFLGQDFAPALTDLDLALERDPRHIGALSGRALTLMGLGRDREALAALEAALALHPWLNERQLVPELRRRLGVNDL